MNDNPKGTCPAITVPGHESSLLPAGRNWKLVWNDEFDGTELDRTKWDFRLNFWGRRFPAFTDEGVVLDGKDFRDNARISYTCGETPDGFHRFGVDWNRDGYVFYCDGRETTRTTGPVSRVEQFVLLTTEPKGYRCKVPAPEPELLATVLPDCFTVDFVRVFDAV